VFGLIAAVAAPFIVDWIRAGVDEQGVAGFWMPIGLTILVAVVALVTLVVLAISVVSPNWRDRVWRRSFDWVVGLHVTTRSGRERIEASGYERRSEEVRAERETTPRPSWRVTSRDRLFGQTDLHWLENRGYEAFDVGLTCDPDFFKIDGEVFFGGSFGTGFPMGSIGKQFFGAPTERGREEGVTFTVTWRDKNGDSHSAPVYMNPEDIRLGKDDAIEEARNVAWKEGYAAAQAATESQPPEPKQPPLPRPRWIVEADTEDGAPDWYTIQNLVPRSVAREVRVEAGPEFQILDAGHWEDLSTSGPASGRGSFQAWANDWAVANGVDVVITWYDEQGNAQVESKHVWPSQPSPDPF